MSINIARVQSIIEKLATISISKDELTRLAFTQEDEVAHRYLIELCNPRQQGDVRHY